MRKKKINAMSLFANVGIAETYFKKAGIDVVLANEVDSKRADFYSHLYPETEVIKGDVQKKNIKSRLVKKAKEYNVQLIIATPPCQGMSTAGKKNKNDPRNALICDAVDIIKKVKPRYVLLENVPEQMITKVNCEGEEILIPDYIEKELGKLYSIESAVLNAADYGVAQSRERAIFLLTDIKEKRQWGFPRISKKRKTMMDAIGDLPILDPFVSDISEEEMSNLFPKYKERKDKAKSISRWHNPPTHIYRQVYAMMHTPTGRSAFENEDIFKPHKKNGEIVKGYKNTYKRQEWDKPAFTITMYNRTISSQNNVHPGRLIGKDKEGNKIYSDPRVLTIFELMRVMSLPDDWDIPKGYSESFIRSVIGEGIPPLLVLKIVEGLPDEV